MSFYFHEDDYGAVLLVLWRGSRTPWGAEQFILDYARRKVAGLAAWRG